MDESDENDTQKDRERNEKLKFLRFKAFLCRSGSDEGKDEVHPSADTPVYRLFNDEQMDHLARNHPKIV